MMAKKILQISEAVNAIAIDDIQSKYGATRTKAIPLTENIQRLCQSTYLLTFALTCLDHGIVQTVVLFHRSFMAPLCCTVSAIVWTIRRMHAFT